MIHFFLLVSRQGKCRLSKWYTPHAEKEKKKMIRLPPLADECVPSSFSRVRRQASKVPEPRPPNLSPNLQTSAPGP